MGFPVFEGLVCYAVFLWAHLARSPQPAFREPLVRRRPVLMQYSRSLWRPSFWASNPHNFHQSPIPKETSAERPQLQNQPQQPPESGTVYSFPKLNHTRHLSDERGVSVNCAARNHLRLQWLHGCTGLWLCLSWPHLSTVTQKGPRRWHNECVRKRAGEKMNEPVRGFVAEFCRYQPELQYRSQLWVLCRFIAQTLYFPSCHKTLDLFFWTGNTF